MGHLGNLDLSSVQNAGIVFALSLTAFFILDDKEDEGKRKKATIFLLGGSGIALLLLMGNPVTVIKGALGLGKYL